LGYNVLRGVAAALPLYDAPSGRTRRHRRHRTTFSTSAPGYARFTIVTIALLLVATLIWRGIRWVWHPAREQAAAYSRLTVASSSPGAAPWERDVMASLAAGAQDAGEGKLVAAEMDVDRAASIITGMRLQSSSAQPEFFEGTISALDRVARMHPEDKRLVEHVALARVELAGLRSSLDATALPAETSAPETRRVRIAAPRSIEAGHVLDPATLGGDYLDGMLMPDTAEILLPPASRMFTDNVRVENLIIAGAAQTLDGVHWHNVTFIGTRLRYQGGELDLRNVRFVRCRFGFSSDDRGARLANALALGQSSLVIE
jgi:hypothetical protein